MFSAGFSVYFMPVIKRLLDDMLLPDMPIGFNSDDVPARDEDVGGGPYFGYCNVPRLTSNLPLPDLWGVDPLTCGKDCTPFSETDHRKEQAIFLGRPTGWHKGARRAVIAAGKKHPEYIVYLLSTENSLNFRALGSIFCVGVSRRRVRRRKTPAGCAEQVKADYAPLVTKLLSRYRGGINVADVLNLKVPPGRSAPVAGGARPVVYLVNNTLHYADNRMAIREGKGMFSAGFSTYFMPVIRRLLNDMLLPDMPIGFNPIDEPARDEDVGGGPYFGYCNVPRLTSNLPLPDLGGVDPLTCGKYCTPFSVTDHRKDQAIFLGRPTGWHKGARRAVIAAGRKDPEYIVSVQLLEEYSRLLLDPGKLRTLANAIGSI
ncbi:hypothetical protein WJX79_009402 [Trebouxia sp. C0005]